MQNVPAVTPEDKIDNEITSYLGLFQNEFRDQSINLVEE